MKYLALLLLLVALTSCLSLNNAISPNPNWPKYSQACQYDIDQNLMNVNAVIVPKWYNTGRCALAGKSLVSTCKYILAITKDPVNCVVQISANCQYTNSANFASSYEYFISRACCSYH